MALKQAQAALADVGVYAGMTITQRLRGVPTVLAKVLRGVGLPQCVVEAVTPSFYNDPPILNAPDLDETYTVRRLVRDLTREIDATLVAVARGDYEGVTLSLGDQAAQRERALNAARADSRRAGVPVGVMDRSAVA
jgi:hypothetical protein